MGQYRFWARLAGLVMIAVALGWMIHSKDGIWVAVGVGCALAIGLVFTALTKWSTGADFVLLRSRLFLIGGIAIAVLGFGASLVAPLTVPGISEPVMNTWLYLGTGCLLLGVMIAMTPRMMRRVRTSQAELAAIRPQTRPGESFGAIDEAVAACRSVLVDWPVFLQIAAPWIVVLAGGLLSLLWLTAGVGHDRNEAYLLLAGFAVLLIGSLYVILPTIAVAWFRWVLEGRRPRTLVALPDKAVFSLAWRLWLFLSILGTADRTISTQVQGLAGVGESQTAGLVASWAVLIGGVAVTSSFALRLPAIATGDQAFTRTAALVQGRRMWPALPVALILSLAPFILLAWAAGRIDDALFTPAAAGSGPAVLAPGVVAQLIVLLILVCAAIASGATLLSRAYQKAKAGLLTA